MTISRPLTMQKSECPMPSLPLARISKSPSPSGAVDGRQVFCVVDYNSSFPQWCGRWLAQGRPLLLNHFKDMEQMG